VAPRSKRTLNQRARATLWWGLAAFLLWQASLRIGIDYALPELRDPVFETKARQLERTLARLPQPPTSVLMLGSSITESAFKAKFLEDLLSEKLERPVAVVNMARPGGGPMCDLIWTRRLLDRGIRPTLLLVEISPFLFQAAGDPATSKPVDIHLFPAYFLERRDVPILAHYAADAELRRQWWEARLVPSYGHRLTMLSYLARELVPIADQVSSGGDHDGRFWRAAPPDPPEVRHQKVEMRVKHLKPILKDFTTGNSSLEALDELLTLLEKTNIGAALVVMPKATEIRRLYHAENLHHFIDAISSLGQRHDCRFLDAFEWLADDMFSDGYHLNTEGADNFSRRLAVELVAPALAAAPAVKALPRAAPCH
jgi:hypothetical protein